MASTASFQPAFDRVFREIAVEDYVLAHTEPFSAPSPEVVAAGEAWADGLIAKGRLATYFTARYAVEED